MTLSKYRVAEVMQGDVALADPAGPIRQVFTDIATAKHRCLVVVDPQRHPIGIVTEGDVIRMVLSEQVPGGQHLLAITSSLCQNSGHRRSRRSGFPLSPGPRPQRALRSASASA